MKDHFKKPNITSSAVDTMAFNDRYAIGYSAAEFEVKTDKMIEKNTVCLQTVISQIRILLCLG